MNMALTSYLLSLAVFIPVSGRVADRFGARTVFRAAIGCSRSARCCAPMSHSLRFLVGSRIPRGSAAR